MEESLALDGQPAPIGNFGHSEVIVKSGGARDGEHVFLFGPAWRRKPIPAYESAP